MKNSDGASAGFKFTYGTNIYVPNYKNQFFVQQLDGTGQITTKQNTNDAGEVNGQMTVIDGQPVEGADFRLYSKEQVAVAADGRVTVKDSEDYYDRVVSTAADVNDVEHAASFPSADKKLLENGVYYLQEYQAADGYVTNPRLTKVIISQEGVFADAGEANDGITVEVGVGRLAPSIVHFAILDKVDATLHYIKAYPQQTTALNEDGTLPDGDAWTYPFEDEGTVEIGEDDEGIHAMHFNHYDKDLLQGRYELNTERINNGEKYINDTGYTQMDIRQCWEELIQNTNGTSRQKLTTPITKLFAGETTVQVTNAESGDLAVSKTVAGAQPDAHQAFDFTLALTAPTNSVAGFSPAGSYACTLKDGDTTVESGTVTTDEAMTITEVTSEDGASVVRAKNGKLAFKLKHGEPLTITGLPVGSGYEAKETDSGEYMYSAQNASGNIVAGETTAAAFTNTRIENGGALTVRKNVPEIDDESDFQFDIVIQSKNGEKVDGTYDDVTITEGRDSFTLKDGETKTFANLPTGTTYEVTEREAAGYTTQVSGADENDAAQRRASDTTEEKQQDAVTFTNTKRPAPTGDLTVKKSSAGTAATQRRIFILRWP